MSFFKRLTTGTSAAVLTLSSLLSISFTGVAQAAANVCSWTGTTDLKFSTATNWANCGGVAPTNGDAIALDRGAITADTTLNNDISNLSLAGITITGTGTKVYTIGGNSLTATGSIAADVSMLTFNTAVTLGADVTIRGSVYAQNGGSIDVNGHTLTIAGTAFLYGTILGTGTVVASTSSDYMQSAGSNFSGTVQVASGSTASLYPAGGAPALSIASGGQANFCKFVGQAYAGVISVGGNAASGYGALNGAAGCGMGAAPSAFDPNASVELTGSVTLTADTVVNSDGEIKISGALSGAHTITMAAGALGRLTIASSNNTSQTGNGQQVSAVKTTEYNDNNPTGSLYVSANEIGIIDGTYDAVNTIGSAIVKGTGTVNTLILDAGSTVAPGHSPGTLTVLDYLSLVDGSTYQAELLNKGSYDQLQVGANFVAAPPITNAVDLGNATLDTILYSGYKINAGDTFTIIDNKSTTDIKGTFKGLAEGATFKVGNGVFKITYKGGDGNDVVLSVVTVPTTPDTGFAVLSANPTITLLGTLVVAAGIALVATKLRKAPARR